MAWHDIAPLIASCVDTGSTCWLTDKSLFITGYICMCPPRKVTIIIVDR